MEQSSKTCFTCFKLLGPLSVQVNITEQLHVMTTKHIHNSIVHCNSIVRLVANQALHCARSPMWENVAYLRCKYGVDFTNALNANINSINVFHQLDETLPYSNERATLFTKLPARHS